LIAASAPAQAEIIVSALQNVPTAANAAVGFDIDGDGSDDFEFYSNTGAVAIHVLQANHEISLQYSPNDPITYPLGTWDSSYLDAADLVTGGGGYAGFLLYRSGTDSYHLGWMQFSFPTMNTSDPTGLMVRAAWESVEGVGIAAGAAPVPEPGSAGLLSSLLAGFGITRWWRGRRKGDGAKRD
jgi:hypothetical protein